MRSKQNLNKALQRQRNKDKGYPQKHRTYEDVAAVPQHLSTTADRKTFILLNDKLNPEDPSSDAKRIIVFMSQSGKEILAGCTKWYVDGTFELALQTLFKQIVFVVGLTNLGKQSHVCMLCYHPKKKSPIFGWLSLSKRSCQTLVSCKSPLS